MESVEDLTTNQGYYGSYGIKYGDCRGLINLIKNIMEAMVLNMEIVGDFSTYQGHYRNHGIRYGDCRALINLSRHYRSHGIRYGDCRGLFNLIIDTILLIRQVDSELYFAF